MTAAQKTAQANFKKAIAYRSKTGCSLKEAFEHVKGSKVNGLDKVIKKGNKTSVFYTKKAKKKAAQKKKINQGVLFGIKEYNIKDDNDNYFYLSLKTGKPAFSNSPDRANIFTADEAIKVKEQLKKEGYKGLSVVKYNKDWYKMGSVKKIAKRKTAKKSAVKSTHKDTKSHNVNIRVVSGFGDIGEKFTRINNDVNGNPRYVIHFFDVLNTEERNSLPFTKLYEYAVKKAKKIGGKKYSNKSYGGGIVFQSYNIENTWKKIQELKHTTPKIKI